MTSLTGTLIPAVVVLVVVSVAGWAFGLEPGPALLIALVLVAFVGLRQVPPANPDEDWPPAVDTGADQGVRREVARLSWSLQGHESRVERPSLLRLRALTDHRLAEHGLQLANPADERACQALLGPATCRTLSAGPRAHVTFAEFAAAVTAVERLTERTSP